MDALRLLWDKFNGIYAIGARGALPLLPFKWAMHVRWAPGMWRSASTHDLQLFVLYKYTERLLSCREHFSYFFFFAVSFSYLCLPHCSRERERIRRTPHENECCKSNCCRERWCSVIIHWLLVFWWCLIPFRLLSVRCLRWRRCNFIILWIAFDASTSFHNALCEHGVLIRASGADARRRVTCNAR